MKKFEIRKRYGMNSICDSDCWWYYTVIGRTACTVTLKSDRDKIIKCRISKGLSAIYGAEACRPLGTYSMCPTLTAENIVKEKPKQKPSYDEMVSICKNIAEEYNTMFETRDYSEYGWASLSFMTDKFGGTYINIHYDHMTGEMINWYGSKDAEKIESVTQLRRLVKYYMEKELKARDFDALSDFINSQY